MNDELNPPWVAFPEIPAGSIEWRTGEGEPFLEMFSHWYGALNDSAAASYTRRYPEPDPWLGTYATIRERKWI